MIRARTAPPPAAGSSAPATIASVAASSFSSKSGGAVSASALLSNPSMYASSGNPNAADGRLSTPTRSRTVLSYSTLFSRCATTHPGLIGPASPCGNDVDPAAPVEPSPAPMWPVQPRWAKASASAASAARGNAGSFAIRLHREKRAAICVATTTAGGMNNCSSSTCPPQWQRGAKMWSVVDANFCGGAGDGRR